MIAKEKRCAPIGCNTPPTVFARHKDSKYQRDSQTFAQKSEPVIVGEIIPIVLRNICKKGGII